jgi:hypothetical protein
MQAVTFEIVVCATRPGFGVPAKRWYVESLHTRLEEAQEHYARIREDWPDIRLVVALIQSQFDEQTRLFRDIVLDARDRSVLFRRREARPLSPAERAAIQASFSRYRSGVVEFRPVAFRPGPTVAAPLQARPRSQVPLALAVAGGFAAIALALALR